MMPDYKGNIDTTERTWRLARAGSGLELCYLSKEEEASYDGYAFALFPVRFATREEAEAVIDFVERLTDKALATRPITISIDGVTQAVIDQINKSFKASKQAGSRS
jgi:hypothetical protein